jgi:hypothetical protein
MSAPVDAWRPDDDISPPGLDRLIDRIDNATADYGVRKSAEATLRALRAALDAALAERDDWRQGARAEASIADTMKAERDALRAALAEVVRVAVEKEREACIAIANERGAWASNDADAESLVDRLEANGRMDMAKEIAAAIRARSTEGGA